jgi:hypothetical protein
MLGREILATMELRLWPADLPASEFSLEI